MPIKITDLNTAGIDLFSDEESYLAELSDDEATNAYGGFFTSPVCISVATRVVVSIATRWASGAISGAVFTSAIGITC